MTGERAILVFDSGVGGLSVVDALRALRLPLRLDYLADDAWLPYGEKSDAALLDRVPGLIAAAVGHTGAELVVMACNTASTIVLEATRAALTVPVVGTVPPIKPAAALTKTGVIGLLATPATIRRPYTDALIAEHAAGRTVLRHGTTALVTAAEAKLAGRPVELSSVGAALQPLFEGPDGARLDVVALGCTHFPLLVPELDQCAPHQVVWLDSGAAIARRVAHVLALAPNIDPGPPGTLLATGPLAAQSPRLRPAFRERGFEDAVSVSVNHTVTFV